MLRNSLENIRVLDFTQIGAGPLATMLLADLGADVIKVEPLKGDVGRKLGPPWYNGQSPIFIAFNRGKRSLCIDLKTEDGQSIIRELAEKVDIVVESFRPGVMDRLGLGYDSLKKTNPGLVYCSVSAYGQTGPYASHPGIDGIMQAASGLMGLIGVEETEPCKVQAPVVDIFSGYVAGNAILAQLIETGRTGRGEHLDVNLFASAIALQQSAVTAYLGEGAPPVKLGSAAPYSAPNEALQASDGWVMVAAYLSDQWPRLCRLLGLDWMIEDSRFRTSSDRVVNRAVMRDHLSAAFKSESCATWLAKLEREDIICSKVLSYPEVVNHPQLDHLNLIIQTENLNLGVFQTPGFPVNSRDCNKEPYGAPPALGQHTKEVLRASGYADARIDKLILGNIVMNSSPNG